MAAIDLNSDLAGPCAAWWLDDEAILDLVTSVGIAAGAHSGHASSLRRRCQAAADRGVRIGARVSSPDALPGAIGTGELRDAVLYQLGALDGFAQVAGTGVAFVAPHGALARGCLGDPALAEAVVEAALEYDPSMAVLGAAGSHLLAVADAHGIEAVAEASADRANLPDGRPVPRSEPGSVIADPEQVAARAVAIATARRVPTIDGGELEVRARSIRIHGDTPGAVALGRAVRAALETAGVGIHPFTV